MKTVDLYRTKANCCGCELCSQVCPKHIIEMKPDGEGFVYPSIEDESLCIDCHKCLKACPMKGVNRMGNKHRISYGGYAQNEEDVKRSASGGYAYLISTEFIKNGGVVYGVKYTDDFLSVEYSRAEKREDIELFRGSKYVQASKGTVYCKVQEDLKADRKVLFVGLPCEISALYHYLGVNSSQLYTAALICHGPTAQKVHKSFCSEEFHNQGIHYFTMRGKLEGWKPYYIRAILDKDKEYQKKFIETDYDVAFKYLKRPSCSVCKYKLGNQEFGVVSDIILGDYHGVRSESRAYNKWGVSQVSIFSDKGEELFSMIKSHCVYSPIDYSVLLKSNMALVKAIPQRFFRGRFSRIYQREGLHIASTDYAIKIETRIRTAKKSMKSIGAKVKSLLRRLVIRK